MYDPRTTREVAEQVLSEPNTWQGNQPSEGGSLRPADAEKMQDPIAKDGSTTSSNADNKSDPNFVDEPAKFGNEKGELTTVSGPALQVLNQIALDDEHHPIHWSPLKKWSILGFYCLLEVWTTLTSTAYVGVEYLIQEKFGGSTQVITLGQSMYIVGNALGPVVLGPLSDIGGRKWVYAVSIFCFALVNIGCALAPDLPFLIVFQFLSGTAASVATANVAGTCADLFGDADGAGQPMALFVAGANYGPSLGSPVGEWIAENTHMGWRWLFWLNVIIGGAFSAIMTVMPETLPRIIISREAAKNPRRASVHEVAIAETKISVLGEMRFIITMALRIMCFEPIVTFLAIFNGFTYGLLFLYLDGVFDVFAVNNGLSYINADLTYLNFLVGVTIVFAFMPVQTWFFKRDRERNGGVIRPEARFITSLVAVWGFPISLYWFAFTDSGNVSFWSPVVAGGLLGFSDPLLFQAMLSYITDSYPNVANSAIAAFVIPSFLIAAACAHLGILLFDNLSTKWAMFTLACISLLVVALVYILYFFGAWLRSKSKLARNF